VLGLEALAFAVIKAIWKYTKIIFPEEVPVM